MLVSLCKQLTTLPKVRTAIQARGAPASVLADRFGTTEQTAYKWRNHDGVDDGNHTPHRLQTILTPTREAVAAALHRTLAVSLEDVSAMARDFLNPNASHRGLDRFLRWHGVGNPPELRTKAPQPKPGAFKTYDPERVHIDVKYLPKVADEPSRCYLLVAINRATRWVFIRALKVKTVRNARRFLQDLKQPDPVRVGTILPDNGKEVTDRLFGLRKRAATGEHDFDTLCAELGIEYRLTPPRSLQTNGLAERFNGREKDVLQSPRFRSCGELEMTLHRYVWLYNQQVSQSALDCKTPLQPMREWHRIKSEMLTKRQYYLPGCDSYPRKVALSKPVNSLTRVSFHSPRENCPEITGRYHKGVLRSPSYFTASRVSGFPSIKAENVKLQREAAQGYSHLSTQSERHSAPRGFR